MPTIVFKKLIFFLYCSHPENFKKKKKITNMIAQDILNISTWWNGKSHTKKMQCLTNDKASMKIWNKLVLNRNVIVWTKGRKQWV